MTASAQNLTTFSGDTRVLRYTITDDAGDPFDLTGSTLAWRCARKLSGGFSTPPAISKASGDGVTVTDAAAGKAEVALAPADTAALVGRYYHELQVTDVVGNVSTVATGTIIILRDLITA